MLSIGLRNPKKRRPSFFTLWQVAGEADEEDGAGYAMCGILRLRPAKSRDARSAGPPST